MLVHAFVSCRLDYCNSLLSGLPSYQLHRLQHVLNTAARIVTLTRKYDHITPVLKRLHWLPIEQRIKYKVLVFMFMALNKIAPDYICDMVKRYEPKHFLRSKKKKKANEKLTNVKYGDRAFTNYGPAGIIFHQVCGKFRN